jgi:hypothetical protein
MRCSDNDELKIKLLHAFVFSIVVSINLPYLVKQLLI